MASSLFTVRDSLDDFLCDFGTLHYRLAAGLTSELPLSTHFAHYGALTQPETFQEIREVVERKSTDDRERARLKLLLEFVATQMEERLAAENSESVLRFERESQIPLSNETLSFSRALFELPRETQRLRRRALSDGMDRLLLENTGAHAKRIDSANATARGLGFDGYLSLREKVTGVSQAELAKACATVLSSTEDAYRDLLGYVLRKLDRDLRPLPTGDATWGDLQAASFGHWLTEHLPPGDLVPAASRWLSDIGMAANAQGRIQLDMEERGLENGPAFAAILKVPDDIRVVLRAKSGLPSYNELFYQFGLAQHAAHTARTAPVEERRLGDSAVSAAYGVLFENVLLHEAWHRRYLRTPSSAAKETTRLVAFTQLRNLRQACAMVPYEMALYSRGVTSAVAEEFEERQTAALFVTVSRGNFLRSVRPQLAQARNVRAVALEANLHAVLRDRFNEDFWRNPAAGTWIKDLFARGLRDSADTLAKQFGQTALHPSHAASRLMKVMGS